MSRRPYDKVELAVSGRSTCRLCQRKIAKGSMRVAIHTLNRGMYWNPYYYHKECMKSEQGINLMKNAKFKESALPGTKRKSDSISPTERIEIEAATVRKKKRISEETIRARGSLREALRKTRLNIARRFDKPAFMVFHDSVLDSLVERLPCNTTELRKVSGFGPKNSPILGPMLLPTIRAYKSNMSRNANFTATNTQIPPSPTSVTELKRSDEEEQDVFEGEVSLDDIIERKIKEAEKRGDLIEVLEL